MRRQITVKRILYAKNNEWRMLTSRRKTSASAHMVASGWCQFASRARLAAMFNNTPPPAPAALISATSA